MKSLEANEDGSFKLSCGCTTEFINGKFINILCDLHDNELEELQNTPVYTKKTKMRDYLEN